VDIGLVVITLSLLHFLVHGVNVLSSLTLKYIFLYCSLFIGYFGPKVRIEEVRISPRGSEGDNTWHDIDDSPVRHYARRA
jgi:hypothetical protein